MLHIAVENQSTLPRVYDLHAGALPRPGKWRLWNQALVVRKACAKLGLDRLSSLREGDGFNDPSSLSDEISSLQGVPCTEPHDNEAFAVSDLTVDDYPEGEAMADLAYASCHEQFEGFVGRDYDSSSLDIIVHSPDRPTSTTL